MSVEGSPQGFSGTKAAQIVGITYRQLDYWARTDLVRPSLADASGSGSRRRYSYRDLLELKVIKTLLDSGIKLESVRDVFHYLRHHLGEDVASAHLVISGSQVVLCGGDELVDVLRRGQGVLNVLPLASVKTDVDAAIELRPVTAPKNTAPKNTAPQVTAPQVTAPQVTAPQVTAPQITAAGTGR